MYPIHVRYRAAPRPEFQITPFFIWHDTRQVLTVDPNRWLESCEFSTKARAGQV